jgi:uncharacterized repeat protein (TIGR03847 family)
MASVEIEINPVKFITIGTVGPKGKRQFYLQAGDERETVALIIEKAQANALAEAVRDLLDELLKREDNPLTSDSPDMSRMNMELREPIIGRFRVERMGLGYDDSRDMVVLVAQEMLVPGEGQEPGEASVVRLWCTRQQMRALYQHTADVVKQGRADPAHNGRVLYYWT